MREPLRSLPAELTLPQSVAHPAGSEQIGERFANFEISHDLYANVCEGVVPRQ